MNDDEEKIQRRKLIEAENAGLWEKITKDISPLDRRDIVPQDAVALRNDQNRIKARSIEREFLPELPLQNVQRNRDLDARTQQRLRKGQMEIEARLDLHGLNQTQAYDALMMFIRKAIARELRCVLVITGKGAKRTEDNSEPRGVLQKRVPEWLNEPRMHEHILKTQEAQPKDGGRGALYVLLRRRRD